MGWRGKSGVAARRSRMNVADLSVGQKIEPVVFVARFVESGAGGIGASLVFPRQSVLAADSAVPDAAVIREDAEHDQRPSGEYR